jgi:hypothetical protein
MSLSAWEQQTLDSIKDELTDSDPSLVTLLTTFTRLASGEAMPVRDKLRAGTRRLNPSSFRRQRRCCQTGACRNSGRGRRRLGLQHALMLAWFVITAGLIGVTLILNHGAGKGKTETQACSGSWPVVCASVAPHAAPG